MGPGRPLGSRNSAKSAKPGPKPRTAGDEKGQQKLSFARGGVITENVVDPATVSKRLRTTVESNSDTSDEVEHAFSQGSSGSGSGTASACEFVRTDVQTSLPTSSRPESGNDEQSNPVDRVPNELAPLVVEKEMLPSFRQFADASESTQLDTRKDIQKRRKAKLRDDVDKAKVCRYNSQSEFEHWIKMELDFASTYRTGYPFQDDWIWPVHPRYGRRKAIIKGNEDPLAGAPVLEHFWLKVRL